MPGRSKLQRSFVVLALLALGYAALVLTVRNSYYQLMLTLVPVWAILGISWNIFSGNTGLVSFGHAAFFGLGAYTVAIAMIAFGLTPWLGIPLAGIAGALAAVVIGVPTFRLRGHYFALAMLAYPLALLYVFEWLGFQEVALPMHTRTPGLYMQFSDGRVHSLLALALLAVTTILALSIGNSRFGLALLAIKQNELAAEAAGIDTWKRKLQAFIISGAIAGVVGGFYAVVLLIVTPHSVFGMLVSAQALIVTLFGGVGVAWGPLIGAAILVPLSETLHAELGNVLPGIQGVVFGVAIILAILLAPEGIYWKLRDRFAPGSKAAAKPADQPSVLEPVEADETSVPRQPRTSGRAVLQVVGLGKRFGVLKAVDGVSFTAHEHEILGIIGPNGAGKTTLFNLLNGFVRPDAGTVVYEGENIAGMVPNAVCRRGIARTFQVARPFRRLTVLDNVMVGALVSTTSAEQARRQALDALALVGMQGQEARIAGGLPGFEQRLMELARALASRPKLLLLDEILAGLGAGEVETLCAVIKRLSGQDITIIIIEHTMRAMVKLSDRFIVLDHGTLLADGNPQDVVRKPEVIEAYLGKRWAKRA